MIFSCKTHVEIDKTLLISNPRKSSSNVIGHKSDRSKHVTIACHVCLQVKFAMHHGQSIGVSSFWRENSRHIRGLTWAKKVAAFFQSSASIEEEVAILYILSFKHLSQLLVVGSF